ncbi:MAG: DUF1549 domain-containing protein, partial [Planctomycetaceae bacterium]
MPSGARADEPVDYVTQIKPLLKTKCYSCHSAIKQEADLRLETRQLMLDGEVIAPGSPSDSEILSRITAGNESRMPPPEDGSALKPDEINLLRNWIKQGAMAPDEPTPAAPTEHWAFRKIARPVVPQSSYSNPIDRFLDTKRRDRNLVVQSAAERSILLRRLYLDLIGLPPTLEQLHDERPWIEIVDSLLESPHHGERWGRHWMDVWRYSDWYGLGKQLRNSQKHMWHWRDWIIESLNQDKGYDQMVREMLAGDEIAPTNLDTLRATGFLARNYYLFNRTTWLDSTIEHTGKAFLGLTLNCAKCHDHKYDPITHEDYYSFRAIFEPHQIRLDPTPGTIDFEANGIPRAFDDHINAPTYLHKRGDSSQPDKSQGITARIPSLFSDQQPPTLPVDLPPFAFAPSSRDYFQNARLSSVRSAIESAREELVEANAALNGSSQQKPSSSNKPIIDENFTSHNQSVWQLVGKGWSFADGSLNQTIASRDNSFVRLKRQLPRDFEVTCRYKTTGGATYKSVTFRFDESPDGSFNNFVYTSAHAPDPKVQIAFTRNGKNNYPAAGRHSKPINVNRWYTLRFAVQGKLVNVWLDDEFILAYELPERRDGTFSVSGFDATVTIDSLAIHELPSNQIMTTLDGKKRSRKQTEAHRAKMATAQLDVQRKQLAYLQAAFAADIVSTDEERKPLAIKAAQAEARFLLASAAFTLLETTDAARIKQAKADQAKANSLLAKLKTNKPSYTSIRASRKALETPAHKETDYPATYSRISTGRRTALAKWITSSDNPLTARVAVNHVWMRHFGQPLVESVFDFGLRAPRPAHAELLDYLAAEFMASDWSFRKLHRLIVTSDAYRMSSSTANAPTATLTTDPSNQFYWRMNARRMESQIIRDSLLQLSGKLDPT